MLTPTFDKPSSKGSKEKVLFVCSCGEPHLTTWKSYVSGRAKSCGRCSFNIWKKSKRTSFGKLVLKTPVEDVKKLSQLVEWSCECGSEKKIILKSVLSGYTSSCGCLTRPETSRTNLTASSQKKSAEEWKLEVPDLLKPDSGMWSRGSSTVCEFMCACGKTYSLRFFKHTKNSTCGKCKEISVKAGDRAGNFKYAGTSKLILTNSDKADMFECQCGRVSKIRIQHVYERGQKTCGKCKTHDEEWWKQKKFGRLSASDPKSMVGISLHSDKKEKFLCSCGNEVVARVAHVLNGDTLSCGLCRAKVLEWHSKEKEALSALSFPIEPNEFPAGGPTPLERIEKASDKAKFSCWLCGRVYKTRAADIIYGSSLSCGCSSGKISKQNMEMRDFLLSLGVSAEIEFDLNGMKYDVAVPDSKLLIEMNGLKWHSLPGSKEKDMNKRKNASCHGWSSMFIYEDEWRDKQNAIKSIVSSRVKRRSGTKHRASKAVVKLIPAAQANEFYAAFHYIGACSASAHFGAFLGESLVACASFGKPTRRSKHDWELVRMASSPDISVVGIWTKIFKDFCQRYSPSSVVSFSDDRMFAGGVYSVLGFRKDGSVKPDYYWTKNGKRHHKSAMRKKPGEIGTESLLREAEGFSKVWDLGKTRWVYDGKGK